MFLDSVSNYLKLNAALNIQTKPPLESAACSARKRKKDNNYYFNFVLTKMSSRKEFLNA